MTAPSRRRASKRTLRILAAVAGALGFALPGLAIRAVPVPTTAAPPPKVIVVPAGTRVTIGTGSKGTGAITLVSGTGTGPAPVSTGGSKPPP